LAFRWTAPIYPAGALAKASAMSSNGRLPPENSFMPTSHADVATEHASRYLQQLCKHWAHKFPVEFDSNHGVIDLSSGRAVLDADAKALHIAVTVAEADATERLEAVVADHIKRFAFREELTFDWKQAPAA
jgi:hypothetical protein